MSAKLLVGLAVLLTACGIEPPQYKEPSVVLTPSPKKDGPFARQTLRVIFSENTRQATKYLADYPSHLAKMGYKVAVDIDPQVLLNGVNRALASRFRTVTLVPDPTAQTGERSDLTMILDARVVIGSHAGATNTVQLSGIFMDQDRQQTIDTVSGRGTSTVRYVWTTRVPEAVNAALNDFVNSLDGSQKLVEYVSLRRSGATVARPAERPIPTTESLRARVRNLRGTAWALVIGINAYRQAERLNYAVNDARAVAAALPALGFQHVRVLLDEEATKVGIERAIYSDLKQRMGSQDRLFVFFAGHGITVRLPRGGEEGYLIPVDGEPAQPELTAIPMDEIRKMGRRVTAKHIFFAIDSCFSGFAATRDITPESVTDPEIAAALEEPVVQVMTAGRRGQKAIEEEGHGLFTRRLLDGLRGLADRERRGFVTVTQLAGWLGPRVVRDSGGRQHPQYSALDGEGDFVFILPEDRR